MKTTPSRFFLSTILVLALASATGAAAQTPESTEDGLVLVKKSKVDVLYRRPGETFSGYTKVMLIEPQIAFKKDWQKDYNQDHPMKKISESDMVTMRTKGRELLLEEFSKVLTKEGYVLVNAPGKDVLGVRISILDLDVAAPDPNNDVGSWNKIYAESAGSATLAIELYDSPSSQLLARAYDRKGGDNDFGMATPRDHRTNVADASYAFRSWAQMFVKGLERAKQAEAGGK